MAGSFDIRFLNDRQLLRDFNRLPRVLQGKALRPVMRDSAKRGKQRIVDNLSGSVLTPRTGQTRKAFINAPVRSASRSRRFLRIGPILPTREQLGIAPWPADRHYYPFALEYGTIGKGKVDAKPFIRPAIDGHKAQEIAQIARELGPRIADQWRRIGR